MALPFSETWAGTNGDAWNASNWTISGNGIINDIQSNAGRMVTRPNGAYTDYNAALLADQASADFDLTVDMAVGSAESYPGVVFRTDGNWNGNAQPLNGFHLEFGVATNAVGLYRMDAGVRTSLAADTVTIQNSTVHVRIQCSGTTIRCRAWTGGSEPSTWLFQPAAQTNHQTRTRHGLSVGNGAANQSATVVWDSLSVARFPFPAFKAAGAPQETITSPTVPWPTHAVGDVGLLLIESCGGEAANLSTAAGFAAVTNSPSSTGATTNGTRVTAYWCRATTTSQASPVITDPGNHVYAVILTFTGCIASGNPWDVTAAAVKAAASTAMSMPSVTTTVANTLIVHVAARDNDSAVAAGSGPSNSNLASLTEQFDLGTALGNGGGLMVWTGERTATGATGATTATVTSSINAYLTVALKPPNPVVLVNADPATATAAGNNATVNITGGLKTVTPTAATATGAGVNAVAGQATSCPAGVAAATGAAIGAASFIRVSIVGDPLGAEDGDQLGAEDSVGLLTEFGPDAVGVSYNAAAVATTGVAVGTGAATGAANGSTIRVATNGGVAASVGAANNPTLTVRVAAGAGTSTGVANGSTGTVKVTPVGDPLLDENGNALLDENGGVVRVEFSPVGVGVANPSTLTAVAVFGVSAGAGAAVGAANGASGGIRVAAGAGAATGAASNPAVRTNETADVEAAAGAGAANTPTPSIGARVGAGGSVGSANGPTGTVVTNSAAGAAVGAANNAAANTAASVTTNPVAATAAGEANGSTTTIVANSGTGTASGAANSGTGNLQPAAAVAASTGTANGSAATAAPIAGTANAAGAALAAAAGTASTTYIDAGAATATAAGLNPSTATTATSGGATAIGAAYNPSTAFAAAAAAATANGQAYNADADSGIAAAAGLAAAAASANDTTSTVVTGAASAAAAGVAYNAVGQLPTVFLSSVLVNVRRAEITVDVRVAA